MSDAEFWFLIACLAIFVVGSLYHVYKYFVG